MLLVGDAKAGGTVQARAAATRAPSRGNARSQSTFQTSRGGAAIHRRSPTSVTSAPPHRATALQCDGRRYHRSAGARSASGSAVPRLGAEALTTDRRLLALDDPATQRGDDASADASGTSTNENRSAISIAPICRPFKPASLAIAPTRSWAGSHARAQRRQRAGSCQRPDRWTPGPAPRRSAAVARSGPTRPAGRTRSLATEPPPAPAARPYRPGVLDAPARAPARATAQERRRGYGSRRPR